ADPFLPRHFGDDGLHDPVVGSGKHDRGVLQVHHPPSRRARREVQVSECTPNMIVHGEKRPESTTNGRHRRISADQNSNCSKKSKSFGRRRAASAKKRAEASKSSALRPLGV